MNTFPLALRISLGQSGLILGLVCLIESAGLMPDATLGVLKGRESSSRAVGAICSSAAMQGNEAALRRSLESLIDRVPEILGVTVRGENGGVVADVGQSQGNLGHVLTVPIEAGEKAWDTVEVRFGEVGVMGVLPATLRFAGLLTIGAFLTNLWYLSIVLRRQPAGEDKSAQRRVRDTLDTLVEGVLVMDNHNRIALANASFAKNLGMSVEEIEGKTAEELGWTTADGRHRPTTLPWRSALARRTAERGQALGLDTGTEVRNFRVNSMPIIDDEGATRGVLATFEDRTQVERQTVQLERLMSRLHLQADEIRNQNRRLEDLATTDPLTSCLNRRTFLERAANLFAESERTGGPLSCVMLDIDHFRIINECHGDAAGDRSLQNVAAAIRAMIRVGDLLGRYGGEEFCVLLPSTTTSDAVAAAERFRREISVSTAAGIAITASCGVSSMAMGASDLPELLNRAVEALQAAKRLGRDRAIRFDAIPPVDAPSANGQGGLAAGEPRQESLGGSIPYHAVASLIAALAHRDPLTAEHSRRVADLCVITARGLLSERDCYVLEIAALLHDIGKLGIPDAILKKPGALTDDEWKVMKAHDGMGVEIITAAFSCVALREIVRTHHARFEGNPRDPDLPSGAEIPIGSRILSIADSYDAMVSDRVYRKGRATDEAFEELRRCAGTQFDPELIDRFITAISSRQTSLASTTPTLAKHDALRIGLLIESLTEALDTRDLQALLSMAGRVKQTAESCGVANVAEVSARLETAIREQADWLDILVASSDLLDHCRSTQATYLATYVEADPPSAPHYAAAGQRDQDAEWRPESIQNL